MTTLTLKAGATFHIRRNGGGRRGRRSQRNAAAATVRRLVEALAAEPMEPPPFSDLLRSFAE